MTFLLSEINHDGIIMVSDSSETRSVAGQDTFVEVDKILYFPRLNVGISTWGKSLIGNQGINEWLEEAVDDFIKLEKTESILDELSSYLAQQLDDAFNFDGTRMNGSIRMGLHITGYNSPSSAEPGFCHVFVDRGFLKFDPQKTLLSLSEHIPAMHLRNGMLDEQEFDDFAIMWPALAGIDTSFRNLIAKMHPHMIRPLKDPLAIRAEWLGNWVKQMCLVIKMSGIPEHIGNAIKVLTFDKFGNARRFELPEIREL